MRSEKDSKGMVSLAYVAGMVSATMSIGFALYGGMVSTIMMAEWCPSLCGKMVPAMGGGMVSAPRFASEVSSLIGWNGVHPYDGGMVSAGMQVRPAMGLEWCPPRNDDDKTITHSIALQGGNGVLP